MYCNTNYVLLSFIAQKIEGKDYSEILAKYITSPLKLKSTYYGNKTEVDNNEALPHFKYETWEMRSSSNLEIYDGALGVRDYIWFWKQQLNTDIHFGFGSVIISPNCSGVGQYNPYINHSKLNKITTETFERTGKNGRVKITLETAAGILTEKRGYAEDNSDYCTEHIFKDVEKDFEKN